MGEAEHNQVFSLGPGDKVEVEVSKVTHGEKTVWMTVTLYGFRATFRFPRAKERVE